MQTFQGSAATDPLFELGEGVLWDDQAARIRWVDINKGRVLAGSLDGNAITITEDVLIGQTAGAVSLTRDGGLLVAGTRGLVTISPEGDISYGPDLLPERENYRLNDAIVDHCGDYIVGTLSLSGPSSQEVLLRVGVDGSVETLREGIQLSNGLGFSPDGKKIYHVDTFAQTLSCHSYGSGDWNMSEPWEILVHDFPAYPDGITVDTDGSIWVAIWGAGRVNQYSSTGKLLSQVTVNASQPSCPGFVGENYHLLAITSAQEHLESFNDESGAVFLANTNAAGLPTNRWAGNTTFPYWR